VPSPETSTPAPRDRSAAAIRSVSREVSGRVSVDGPCASADNATARFVSDLEPGRRTVASIGLSRYGAAHGFSVIVAEPIRPGHVPRPVRSGTGLAYLLGGAVLLFGRLPRGTVGGLHCALLRLRGAVLCPAW